jgi:hypothetical protein
MMEDFEQVDREAPSAGITSAGAPHFESGVKSADVGLGKIPGVELSVIVPTLNERDNVAEVVRRLDRCLFGRDVACHPRV